MQNPLNDFELARATEVMLFERRAKIAEYLFNTVSKLTLPRIQNHFGSNCDSKTELFNCIFQSSSTNSEPTNLEKVYADIDITNNEGYGFRIHVPYLSGHPVRLIGLPDIDPMSGITEILGYLDTQQNFTAVFDRAHKIILEQLTGKNEASPQAAPTA